MHGCFDPTLYAHLSLEQTIPGWDDAWMIAFPALVSLGILTALLTHARRHGRRVRLAGWLLGPALGSALAFHLAAGTSQACSWYGHQHIMLWAPWAPGMSLLPVVAVLLCSGLALKIAPGLGFTHHRRGSLSVSIAGTTLLAAGVFFGARWWLIQAWLRQSWSMGAEAGTVSKAAGVVVVLAGAALLLRIAQGAWRARSWTRVLVCSTLVAALVLPACAFLDCALWQRYDRNVLLSDPVWLGSPETPLAWKTAMGFCYPIGVIDVRFTPGGASENATTSHRE
jgi:hypothetical protein